MEKILLVIKSNFTKVKKFLSGVFSFTKKELVIIGFVGGILILSAIIVTVLVSAKSGAKQKEEVNFTGGATIKEVDNFNAAEIEESPRLSDFIIDNSVVEEAFTGVVFSRQPKQPWTEEEINSYWVEPQKIAADKLEKEAATYVEEIFSDVP